MATGLRSSNTGLEEASMARGSSGSRGSSGRAYLYELDPVRAITALAVVGVHVVAATVIFTHTALGKDLQDGVVSALHFTRETFLSISAFVLVYGYAAKRPFPLLTFWRKRGVGVLLPYLFWSVFYMWVSTPHDPFATWLSTTKTAIILGTASYQLYFILLTLELYLVLPVFLWLLMRVAHHPWIVLGTSFAVQMVMLYLDYHLLQPGTGPWAHTPIGQWVSSYRDQLLPMYQFYVVLGAIGALYMRQVRAFLLRHGVGVALFLLGGLGVLWLRYAVQLAVDPRHSAYAMSVFQPSMVVYSLAVTVFLYWTACRWVVGSTPARPPRGHRVWLEISNATFGIYLIHPFILTYLVLPHIVPLLPSAWPDALRTVLIWFVVAASATVMALAMLYTPGLSRLMGHPWMLPAEAPARRWLSIAGRGAVTWLQRWVDPRYPIAEGSEQGATSQPIAS
jgi:membrane-bound acyltransferase YfiQ involved in biofilm formation